jgi:hypothetical protein
LEKSEYNSDGPDLDPVLKIMRPDQFDGKDSASERKSETVKEILSNTGQAPECSSKSLSSHLARSIYVNASLTFDSMSKTPDQMWERAANLQ